MKLLRVVISLTIFISIFPVIKSEAASSNEVVPINWSSFTKGNPTDENAQRVNQILLNTNKYGLTTWWDTYKNFDAQVGVYLDFGGKVENQIRHPAAMSLGLATSLAFNIYDPEVTNVSNFEARTKTVKLISSLAYRHKSNIDNGWGDHWQSAHWAYFLGFSAWLMWNDLSVTDREYVRKVVEYEANRFNDYVVPYMKAFDGTVLTPGDTKAEENAWNAQILQLATAMMPNHPNWNVWMNKNIELMVSSASTPLDIENNTMLSGKAVKDWIKGINVNEDGTVENHGFIHPDYMEFILFNNTSALQYTLANMATPEAAFFNSDLVYKGLVEKNFQTPSYEAPGGTIYIEGSSEIYYPQGSDWGTELRMNFATLDGFAHAFNYDSELIKGGEYWEPLHAQKVLDMQNRHSDGHTFSDNIENNYKGREEWVAHHAAWAWIAKWVVNSGKFSKTNDAYLPSYTRLGGATRFETAERISKEGWLVAKTVYLARGDAFPDALAGSPLAYQSDSPILLTQKNQLSEEAKREIKRLKAEKVVILGGTAAIELAVEDQLVNMGLQVERIAGSTRFETARKIAEKVNNPTKTAMVVYGYNFPDALSAATIAANNGYPILLTDTNTLTDDTKQALASITKTYVIGGKSVVSDNVVNSLPRSKRVGGATRYETAISLIKEFKLQPTEIFVTDGWAFPDALSGSVLAAKNNANLLLVEKNKVPDATKMYLNQNSSKKFTILGGNQAISDKVVNTLLEE